jgi:flavin-dependent dehydrogenase
MRRYDVIVVGGGPAGSATAALFAAQGRRVLVLDKARFPRAKPCAEYVSPGGVAILARLGALERIEATAKRRWLRGMQITAPAGASHLVGYHDAHGRELRGLAVSRLVLDAALLETARASGAAVREGFRVRDIYHTDGRVAGVIGPSGERVEADLLVGADGLQSVVAHRLRLRRRVLWPRRLGLVTHYAGVNWPEEYGRMLVSHSGYAGVAPLDDDGLVTVGLVCPMPRKRHCWPGSALEAGLVSYPDLSGRLSGGEQAAAVTGIGPLARRVERTAGPGFALVGDAAGFFDPFTGEGIFRALRGAELLAACPERYVRAREKAFGPKQRLVALIQLFVQVPPLMDFAIERLRGRTAVARELGNVLGDLQAARPGLIWRLLGP